MSRLLGALSLLSWAINSAYMPGLAPDSIVLLKAQLGHMVVQGLEPEPSGMLHYFPNPVLFIK